MEIFFLELVKRLDETRKNWRKNHVILMDNAPYHKSNDSLRLFEELRIPLIFTGPHGYTGSPIELFFASFKAADINPSHFPTSKK